MHTPSSEAHPLVTWVSPEHFSHRGLFACVSPDGVEVLRFYPDGRVAGALGDTRPGNLYVFKWLTPGDPSAATGVYRVEPGGRITFTLRAGALLTPSGEEPVIVDYEGTLRGGALTLRVHSRKTGARYEDHYTLHDVTGCDTATVS